MKIDEITPDVRVEELIEEYPSAQWWLLERGVVCVQCGEIFWGSLKDLIITKGLDPDEIVEGLKKFLKESEG